MHSRALARGFDFVNWGHYRIKDYPQYFMDPLSADDEAALRASAVGVPGVVVTSNLNGGGQQQGAYQGDTMGMNHDVISLAANVAAGSPMGGNVYNGSGVEALPPLVPGLASEMSQVQETSMLGSDLVRQVQETPMLGSDLVRALNMSRDSSSMASSTAHASGSSNDGSFHANV